jgi:hypothetical protein
MQSGFGRRVILALMPMMLLATTAIATAERFAHLDFLLERTWLKVDIARLVMDVDEETARAVAAIVERARYLETRRADLSLEFKTDVSFDRFLDSAAENSKRLVDAGLIEPEAGERMVEERGRRFAFLEETGIRDGDRFEYTLRGDTVTTRYFDADDSLQIEFVGIGARAGAVLLGTYFVRGSSFFDGLMDLLFAGH